jgi:hypothetical protein
VSHRSEDDADDGHPIARQQLMRVLDMPQLASVVPHLPPHILHEVIRHAGLERCGDLVGAATPEQLTAIFDLDLWGASEPGSDELFDADRFGDWVESLVDRDAKGAARVVARLDTSLLVAGLSRYVRVLDPGVLEPTASTDDEPSENGLFATDGLTAALGGYIVQARRLEAWDTIVSLLVELSAEQVDCFHAVMRGCRRLSNAGREADGLDDLLAEPEQLLHDVALDRDDRREGSGFIAPADARAFLARAREPKSPVGRENPIAVACFRRAGAATVEAKGSGSDPRAALRRSDAPAAPARPDPVVADALGGFARALAADGLLPERPSALRGGEPAGQRETGGLRPLMEYLREHHPDRFLRRGQELAFLANSLVAGCSLQSRSFTPREASEAAAATCSLGLLQQPAPPDVDFLVGRDLVAVFEDGWAALHREVSLFVAQGLVAILRGVRVGGSDTLDGLHALRQSLETHVAAVTPWLAREALDVLSTLDVPAWYGLLGLLSECPVIPTVVTAIVERRTGRIDPRSFAFVATSADVDTVHAFMARLPQLLAG